MPKSLKKVSKKIEKNPFPTGKAQNRWHLHLARFFRFLSRVLHGHFTKIPYKPSHVAFLKKPIFSNFFFLMNPVRSIGGWHLHLARFWGVGDYKGASF